MELRDQLQSVLGTSYTIERELGGGGMSRVFAATETALGRRVVIKVVPIELGSGLSVDRFKRETLLAANLQHPHIVPVLTAGEMDGVPYYTMPFVDGESLRARLERGTVPIPEAVSVLRDVAKALAYAHEHGVVHRDIKPDNILMSGGSAAVADFGIAKALAAAGSDRGTSSSDAASGMLTQMGMSVGTPMYMAPEQAVADPTANHRADIYSFGCVAYELLAGAPPFSGLAPHKLLVAHMSERPRPVAELRADTPKPLADLVMRCLEKDPNDRPQTAGELVRQLDAVTSGATLEAMPAFSRPGAFRLASIAYVLAFAAVAGIVKVATVGIGLPDWVMPAAIVLLAFGFPLVAAAAYFKQFSWRRTAAFGAAGVLAFIGVIGAFMTLRASGVGPFGSLLGAGKLNSRDKILVADFSSTGADTTLGGVVSEAVRADLGQSPIVSVVTPQTVAAALQRMQRPANTRVDTAVARQVALREGVKAIVTGDVHAITGGGFVVTMRLVSADSGQELAAEQASANAAKDLIPTIGHLTRQLRGKMGESLKHLQASAELAQVTTSSLPALEAYSAGQRAMSVEGNVDKAIPLFRRAIALDTGFASAYRALAVALGNNNEDREGQIRAIEKAYAHVDRLPEVERFLMTATYYTQGPKPDPARAMAAYEALLAVRPSNYAALNNAALLYAQKRDFETAERYLRRSIASNPTSLVAYGNLIAYQSELGQIEAEDSTLTAELKVSANNPHVAVTRASILFTRGAYDSANTFIDSLVKATSGDESLEQSRLTIEEASALTRGRLNEGLRLSTLKSAVAAKRGSPSARLSASADSALVEAWFLGSNEKALSLIQAGLERTPLSSLSPLDRPYEGLAQIYAVSGRADLVRAMLAGYEHDQTAAAPDEFAATRHVFLSMVAFAEHRYLDAAHEAIAGDFGQCVICAMPMVATSYDLAQQPDSAVAAFTRYVESTSMQNRIGIDPFFLAGSYKRLGELWEAKGDRAKAAHYYAKFLDLWKNADPPLQQKVVDVRKRLARLSDIETRR